MRCWKRSHRVQTHVKPCDISPIQQLRRLGKEDLPCAAPATILHGKRRAAWMGNRAPVHRPVQKCPSMPKGTVHRGGFSCIQVFMPQNSLLRSHLGQNIITRTPASAMAPPTASPESGLVPSSHQPARKDRTMKKPPYTAYTLPNESVGCKVGKNP